MDVKKVDLFVPPLTEVCEVLEAGLAAHYKNVHVAVQKCPDLRSEPFSFPRKGLSGHPAIVDVGGTQNLLPLPVFDKYYSFEDVMKAISRPDAFALGAGAGPHRALCNAELMIRLVAKGGNVEDNSHVAYIDKESGSYAVAKSPSPEFALMANLFVSDGQPGPIIKIEASEGVDKSDHPTSFYAACREALKNHYGDKPVALGGTFALTEGSARIHVMPDFAKQPLTNTDELNNWLKFFNMPAPLVAMGYFVSHDPGLDLRMEHFHCVGLPDHGGHYHYDVTPDTAKYQAYFNVAETLFRVDQPPTGDGLGRN